MKKPTDDIDLTSIVNVSDNFAEKSEQLVKSAPDAFNRARQNTNIEVLVPKEESEEWLKQYNEALKNKDQKKLDELTQQLEK